MNCVLMESVCHCGDGLGTGGIIVLDNTGWYPNTARLLREEFKLTQIDFHGLKPVCSQPKPMS